MARYSQRQQLGGQNQNTRIQREKYPDWKTPKVNSQGQAYRCPICNNPQIRSLSSIYGRGVYTSVSRRGRFVKRGYTTKTSKSLLADKCAPPEKRQYAFGILLVAIAMGIEFVPLGPLHARAAAEARPQGRAHGRVHQWNRVGWRGPVRAWPRKRAEAGPV